MLPNLSMKAFNTLHLGNVCMHVCIFLHSEGTAQVDPIANEKVLNQQPLKLSQTITGHSVQPKTQIQGSKSTIGRAHHMDFWHRAADVSSAAPCNPPPPLFRVKRAKQQARLRGAAGQAVNKSFIALEDVMQARPLTRHSGLCVFSRLGGSSGGRTDDLQLSPGALWQPADRRRGRGAECEPVSNHGPSYSGIPFECQGCRPLIIPLSDCREGEGLAGGNVTW